jgi:hypothetical protein
MPCVINEARFAVGQSLCDFFRQANGEGPVLRSMPKPHRNTYVFYRKSPRLSIDLRIRHYPFSRPTPGPPLTFKNGFERCRVTQAFCIARSQHEHLQK